MVFLKAIIPVKWPRCWPKRLRWHWEQGKCVDRWDEGKGTANVVLRALSASRRARETASVELPASHGGCSLCCKPPSKTVALIELFAGKWDGACSCNSNLNFFSICENEPKTNVEFVFLLISSHSTLFPLAFTFLPNNKIWFFFLLSLHRLFLVSVLISSGWGGKKRK